MVTATLPTIDRPATLVEALCAEDPAVARAAYGELRRRVARCRHPAVRGASAAEREELVQDIALRLTREPAVAGAAAIHTWAGLDTAIHRWIGEGRGASVEDRPRAWAEHLWEKVGAVLREDARFAAIALGRRTAWALADRPPGADGTGLSDAELRDLLPPLAPRLHAARADQLGEVVAGADLRAQLVRVFELGGNVPRSRTALVDLVLASLAIAAGPARHDDEALLGDLPGDGRAATEAARAATDRRRLAEAFVAALPPRTRAAARLRHGGAVAADLPPRTLDEVARALGVSRGTAEAEVGDTRGRFAAALRALCEAHADGPAEAARLIAAVLEILAAVPYEPAEDPAS